MSLRTKLQKAGKAAVALNLGIIIRALRFGMTDAMDCLTRSYRGVDLFAPNAIEVTPELPENSTQEIEEVVQKLHDSWDLTVSLPAEAVLPLGYNKVCNLKDFRHPELLKWIREIYGHELQRFGPAFPMGFEDRRQWEIAMIVRTFFDHGILNTGSRILGVGVGNEPTSFFLTTRVGQVFATDLYIHHDGWAEADVSMLTNPGTNWPFAWNPRRLVTQHMDGRELKYEDNSFDGVFSTGAIEHFGTLEQIQQSMNEIHRVLKPGGILALTTEFLIEGPDHGGVGLMFFTPELIQDRLVGNLAWAPLSNYDYSISEETLRTEFPQSDAVQAFHAHVKKYKRLLYHKYRQAKYPLIVMRDGDYMFTSVSLALTKV